MTRYRVSMDIGGTFTDVVAYDAETGRYAAGKASTTPVDLTEGVLTGLNQVVDSPADIGFTVHGTTQGLNALLTRRGVRVMLLATAGAGDTYHIARGARFRLYDIHYRKPTPLVPRSDIVEIGGRLRADGSERIPLDEDAVRAAARRYSDEGFGAVSIAFLFSYVDDSHERRAAEIFRDEVGEDVTITTSHQVAREWREYERTSTAVLDAYTAPIVRTYLRKLETELTDRGLDVAVHVMQSSGGITTALAAQENAVQTLLSGPVGGTMGGVALSRLLDRPNLICVDMGGTSFDVSLVIDGRPEVSNEAELEGFPILMPVVDIHTVGAGGGSLAYVEGGGLRVGPESAGATPGPACYGRGGTQPTVTDANLVLGRVDPEWFAGGTMSLDTVAARGAVEQLAVDLDLGTDELAEGICDVINAKMAQAIRTLTVEKGIEPAGFSLVAFGGAGAMHAVFLARELNIAEVIVPASPGAFSAWGMLETELRADLSQSHFTPLAAADLPEVASVLGSLEAEGTGTLQTQGAEQDAIRAEHFIDVRYVGQEYTLRVPLTSATEPTEDGFTEALPARFSEAHRIRFGHANPGAPVELVTLRTTVLGDVGRPEPEPGKPGDGTAFESVTSPVRVDGETHDATVVRRDALRVGDVVAGPALVVEQTATTVLPPRSHARVDPVGALIIAVDEEA